MSGVKRVILFAVILPATLGGCGLYVPEKDVFVDDTDHKPGLPSPEGTIENAIIGHIDCEIRKGLSEALQLPNAQWLKTWGAEVTLTIIADELSGFNPGASLVTPFENSIRTFPVGGNVVSPQSFSLGFGLSGTAHSTRQEVIAYTLSNSELLAEADKELKLRRELYCKKNGIMIDGDLKLAQFIYDKVSIEPSEVSIENPLWAPYNTFQATLNFVASYGGNVTPTWKLATFTANSSSTLLNASRTKTNTLMITFGKYVKATDTSPAHLSPAAENLNNAGLGGNSTAAQIQGTSH